MKKWLISLTLSLAISTIGILYFLIFIAQDNCLDSGGRWLGALNGCDGGNEYSTEYLTSPLAMGIYIAIVVAIGSALIQLHSILRKLFRAK